MRLLLVWKWFAYVVLNGCNKLSSLGKWYTCFVHATCYSLSLSLFVSEEL